MMTVDLRRLGDAELLTVVAAAVTPTIGDPPATLTHADVAAAGRAAWTWRTLGRELDHLLGERDRLGDQ